MHDGQVKIRLSAPPEKGKANAALVAYLAKVLSVKKSAVRIVSGTISPIKQIVVKGVDAAYVSACFNRLCTT